MGRRVPLGFLVHVAELVALAFIAVAPILVSIALTGDQPHSCGGG